MIKRMFIAILVSGSMTACAASAAKNNDNIAKKPAYPSITALPSPTELKDNDKKITLEKIMSDPDWIGQQPENAYWAADSNRVFYQRKRPSNELRDWYVHAIDGGEPAGVELIDQHKIGNDRAVYSNDRHYSAYIFSGDVFVKNLANGHIIQVTRTADSESSPQFLNDNSIAYRIDDNYYAWNINSKVSRQLAELKMTDEPTGVSEPDSYIAKAQHKLIDFVALKHKNAKDKHSQQEQLKQANPAMFKQTWYLGKGNNVVSSKLSPDGKYLAVALQKDVSWRESSDIMPNYVTQDGGITAEPVRRRVADSKPQPMEIVLLDFKQHKKHALVFDSLPGFDEDVLATVKTENYQRQGKTYKSAKMPRVIGLIDEEAMKFNHTGNKLALMLEAWDNKDRWIATVDFDSMKLVSRHRYHDDAWVNYSYNDFGWFHHQDALYYLSEESGFSHLYLLDFKTKAKQLTAGSWEVSNTTLAKDDQYIYFTANKKHPGIYETYRVNTKDGKMMAVTDLGGSNDYSLSPDGSKLLVVHSQIAMPPEIYIKRVGSDEKAKRLTHTVSQAFLDYNWNIPAIVPVKSSEYIDPIFTKVYYPQNYQQGPGRKAAVFVHGAGYTQNSDTGWSYYFREFMFNSMLAQQGYVVIDMDYRASRGYGRNWRTQIYRQMGTPELQDLKDGVKWMVDNANVDPKRVGVYGGSYGGFMTLMSLFKAPDLFKTGAALRLVSDWAYYNHGYTSNILNTPDVDPIAYERSSPIYFAEGLNKPLLINAPMVDNNVYFQDTVRLVQRLIELEKQHFETAIFPVEAHGFRQPSSWLNEYRRIYQLFERHL